MARKRRGIPFRLHWAPAFQRLSPLQQAIYLTLWVVGDADDRVPIDADAVRVMCGRTERRYRIEECIARLIEEGLATDDGDGWMTLVEDPMTAGKRPSSEGAEAARLGHDVAQPGHERGTGGAPLCTAGAREGHGVAQPGHDVAAAPSDSAELPDVSARARPARPRLDTPSLDLSSDARGPSPDYPRARTRTHAREGEPADVRTRGGDPPSPRFDALLAFSAWMRETAETNQLRTVPETDAFVLAFALRVETEAGGPLDWTALVERVQSRAKARASPPRSATEGLVGWLDTESKRAEWREGAKGDDRTSGGGRRSAQGERITRRRGDANASVSFRSGGT